MPNIRKAAAREGEILDTKQIELKNIATTKNWMPLDALIFGIKGLHLYI